MLHAPLAAACGIIIPNVARFGGFVVQHQVSVASSEAMVQELQIGQGAHVEVTIDFDPSQQASKGAVGELLEWIVPAALASAVPDSATYPYEAMTVSVGPNLILEEFTVNRRIDIGDDQVDLSPLFQFLCPTSNAGQQVCDWLWVQGNAPNSISPPNIVALDDSVVVGAQKGVNLILTAESTALSGPSVPLQPGGEQDMSPLTENSVLVLDLIDLTAGGGVITDPNKAVVAQIRLYVAIDTAEVSYSPTGGAVPALSRRGGAVLVLGVLALGLISLSVPGRRLSR